MSRQTLIELAWILPSVAIPVGMLVALVITNYGMHIQLPTDYGTVRAEALSQTPPFDSPGLVDLGHGRYRLTMVAQTWAFLPAEVHVLAGSEVEIYVASRDVTHGLDIQGTNVNLMLIPGRVARATAHFRQPGTHLFICHEYCGLGHQNMSGKIIVDPAP